MQFEVLKHRLECEYDAGVVIEYCPWDTVWWLKVDGEFLDAEETPSGVIPTSTKLARDPSGYWVFLAEGEWALRLLPRYQPDWQLSETAPSGLKKG